jgi:hypothetical protein
VRINEENLHTESGRERRAEIEENRFHLFLGSREEKLGKIKPALVTIFT